MLLLLMVHGDADDEDAEAAMTAEVRMQPTSTGNVRGLACVLTVYSQAVFSALN